MVSRVILFLLSILLSCNQLLPPPKIEEEKVSTSGSASDKVSTTDKFKVGDCSYPRDKKFFVAVLDLQCPETEEKDPYFESTIPKDIRGLELDEDDKLYVVDENKGIFISSDGGKSFDNLTIHGVSRYKGLKVHRGEIFVISDTNLYSSSDGGEHFQLIVKGLEGLKKIEILSQKQTTILRGGQRSIVVEDHIHLVSDLMIYVYKKDGLKLKEISNTKVCSMLCNLQDFSIGNNGYWYVATTKGISISINDGNDFILKSFQNGINENIVKSIFYDPEGKVYFTSLDGVGEFKFSGKLPIYIFDDDQDSELDFLKFFKDLSKNMYVASTKGLYIKDFSSKDFELYDHQQGLAQDYTSHIIVDSKGNIFVGSEKGLSVALEE
jgi:ligand-binding sensor domain-containing protein